MTRETARALKAMDMDLLRAALVLAHMIEVRAQIDQPSTAELVAEIVKSLTQAAQKKEKPTT